ncbi:hypothetical protein OG2516_09815 [Oceanicola granulosus HTCC2516]|uniref:DUF998 domain-containing protein n=1 Tax=Oceanicola granulosus (strain ATCC BAA-861 / DSM 15982 / KCTC 12143 / HTCC2516) TaxID=314256 RepID=Q2CCU1_OCEGH|nr:DUF998 domain-containing protein [Oceanicola granulosus]EAR50532.1 hypothetical protein OG2516_09815 [Oceanicola granulosus HTCC2516]
MRPGPLSTEHLRSELLITLAAITWLGCVSLVAGTLIAPFYVPNYDWVADTISDLAAGETEIIMDIALYGYAAALFAAAIGAGHLHLGGNGWSVGTLSLALLAATVIVVGARNEYGDDDSDGIVIHVYLTYILGVFFALGPLVMAPGAGHAGRGWRWVFLFAGIAWAILAPIFYFLPTHIDGVYERMLGGITLVWLGALGWIFLRQGLSLRP